MELSLIQQIIVRWSALMFLTVTLVGCDVVTGGGPLDRAAALQQSELPLPQSARDVYYHHIDRGTQDHDIFVRFSGEQKDIQQFVEVYFEDQNAFLRQLGKPMSEPVVETDQQAMNMKPWEGIRSLPDWWQPEAIKMGRYIGSGQKALYDQHFWIDEVEGKVFFYGHY